MTRLISKNEKFVLILRFRSQKEKKFQKKLKMETKISEYPITESIIGSWNIEGLEVSPETIQCMKDLADGLISLEDAIKNIKQETILIDSNP